MEDFTSSVPSTTITLAERSFVLQYPNVGQMMDIEIKKQSLSGGHYNLMVKNASTQDRLMMLNFLDAYATFSVLNPDIIKVSKVSFFQLNQIDALDFVEQYLSEYVPFKKKHDDLLNQKWDQLTEKIKRSNEENASKDDKK